MIDIIEAVSKDGGELTLRLSPRDNYSLSIWQGRDEVAVISYELLYDLVQSAAYRDSQNPQPELRAGVRRRIAQFRKP